MIRFWQTLRHATNFVLNYIMLQLMTSRHCQQTFKTLLYIVTASVLVDHITTIQNTTSFQVHLTQPIQAHGNHFSNRGSRSKKSHVRHKRGISFLTQISNFREVSWPPWPRLPAPLSQLFPTSVKGTFVDGWCQTPSQTAASEHWTTAVTTEQLLKISLNTVHSPDWWLRRDHL